MGKKFWKVFFISISILCLAGLGTSYAQKIPVKVGGGEIKFEAKGSTGPVLYSHETHVNQNKAKCLDCHTKIFKMKRGANKITQASFKEGKFCGACHDGKKAFSATAPSECVKCHKK